MVKKMKTTILDRIKWNNYPSSSRSNEDFDFWSVVQRNWAKTLSEKLQKRQNCAVRVLTHSSYDTDANQLITELGWDNSETGRQKLKAEMVYSISL